jgi:nucleoside-diphosphate-sugar epimerase
MHLSREGILGHVAAKLAIPLVCVRPCAIYGPDDPHNSYGLNRFLREALTKDSIALFGEGEDKRDHVFIDNVARIVGVCRSAGIVNVATGTSTSFADMARSVGGEVGLVPTPRSNPVTHRFFDIRVLGRTFAGTTLTNLHDGVAATVQRVRPTPR